jgi:hypothetical protein
MPSMVQPTASAALQQFVDDELMRTPLLVDQVIEGAVDRVRQGMAGMMPHDRAVAGDLLQAVLSNRAYIVDYYAGSLREQVGAELARLPSAATPAAPAARKSLSLSLVDEDEVAVDVEISHAIETIRSVAEYELRELQTFTAALVGDMDLAHDHNPFRAETHARALWAAAQALPLSRGFRISFMRHASLPLAQVLRKTFAGATSRLEASGIEPASYRTLILPSGSRRSRTPETTYSPDLHRILDSMPVHETPAVPQPALEQVLQQNDAQWRRLATDAAPSEYGRLREQQRMQLVESATTAVDQQLIELLTRLFDAVLGERDLPPDIQLLLSRLQASTLRVALRDASMLDTFDHPVWRFMDRVAFQDEILPAPGAPARQRALHLVLGLVEHLSAEAAQDAALYGRALEHLLGQERQRLVERCTAAREQIESLQRLEERIIASPAPISTLSGALDLAELDTVPADLIETDAARQRSPAVASAWLEQRQAGDWMRAFLQGRWVHAQLLWPGEHGEVWLLGDAASDATWAVRQRALLTLHDEHLLRALEPRSLVRAAAKRVMRGTLRSG